jgi:hypothetical protein
MPPASHSCEVQPFGCAGGDFWDAGWLFEGRYYYCPQNLDFGAGQSYKDGIGQDLWQVWLAKVPAQKTLLVLDTCEGGSR